MKNKILLTDIDTKVDIDENPEATKLITKECSILLNDECGLNKMFAKSDKSTGVIPIKEFQNQILAKSNLYKNRYYTLENYNELYMDDLSGIILAFALRMGAKEYSIEYFEAQEEYFNNNFSAEQNADIKANGIGVNQKGGLDIETQKIKQEAQKTYEKHEKIESNKMNKEELGEWIKDEKLDIDALPRFLGEYIKRYLECGKVAGTITKEEELTKNLQENAHYQAELNFGLILPDFLSTNLNLKSNYNTSKGYKFAKKIKYTIVF